MKNVLLLVGGMTPQIVTETLYALTQQHGETVDEIRVITTLEGRNRLLQRLLDPATGKFFEFCRDYRIDPSTITFNETTIALLQTPDGRTLADIRTLEENEWAGDHICEIVRGLAADSNCHIHASAAGGRKTMSIYLTVAMQLFGRVHDTLSHVLVSEDFETHQEFYYIPPTARTLVTHDGRQVSTTTARIHLAPVPFIRLRGASPERWRVPERRYSELVLQTQEELDVLDSVYNLTIDLKERTLSVAHFKVRLPPRELLVYTLFAVFRLEGRGDCGHVPLSEIRTADVETVFHQIARACGKDLGLDSHDLLAGYGFLPGLIGLIESEDTKELAELFNQVNSRIKRRLTSAGRLDRYLIASHGSYAASVYGLDVAPERIVIRK